MVRIAKFLSQEQSHERSSGAVKLHQQQSRFALKWGIETWIYGCDIEIKDQPL